MGNSSKLARPPVNLVTRELLPDRDGSLKIGVVVAEDWPTWDIFLTSMGYQVFNIYSPARFMKCIQGGTLSGTEWLPPKQARRLRNLQYSCFLCLEVQVLSDSYGEEISKAIGR